MNLSAALLAFAFVAACGGKVVVDLESSSTEGSGTPDAGSTVVPPDASVNVVDPTAVVACGDGSCTEPEVCADEDQVGGPTCHEMTHRDEEHCACAFAACDGPEDCPTGSVCSLYYPGNSQGLRCSPTYGQTCPNEFNPVACHSNADCPACVPTCSPGKLEGNYPGLELDVLFCTP